MTPDEAEAVLRSLDEPQGNGLDIGTSLHQVHRRAWARFDTAVKVLRDAGRL